MLSEPTLRNGGVLGLLAHLHEIATPLETRDTALDQKQGHVVGVVLWIGFRRHYHQVGVDAI